MSGMDKAFNIDETALAELAVQARESAYVPYSGFKVGAALLTAGGKVFKGCNIENAAYSPTVCAERTAFFKAVSEGEREFKSIAVAGWRDGETPGMAYPCGVCRQVMMEFTEPQSFRVIVTNGRESVSRTLAQLLPEGFGPSNL